MLESETQLLIDLYRPSDSDEAMRLEARSAQGKAFRLRFDRPYFHRRAENYERWRLLTARIAGELVAIAGGALKPAIHDGRETTALYLFDARVVPEFRRSGIAQRLLHELIDWSRGAAEIAYGYIAGDNEAALRLAQEWIGGGAAAACNFLVYPIYKSDIRQTDVKAVSCETAHAAFIERAGPFGFYCRPEKICSADAHMGSWAYARGGASAACSAWSNEHILAEIVERLPRPLSVAGALSRTWPISRLPMPRVPGGASGCAPGTCSIFMRLMATLPSRC